MKGAKYVDDAGSGKKIGADAGRVSRTCLQRERPGADAAGRRRDPLEQQGDRGREISPGRAGSAPPEEGKSVMNGKSAPSLQPPPPPPVRLALSVSEAARALSISPRSFLRAFARGDLPGGFLIGGRGLWSLEGLTRLVREREAVGAPAKAEVT